MEVKGLCRDCLFLRQEWTVAETKKGQLTRVIDTFCGICDVFKREDGYCDFWEPK